MAADDRTGKRKLRRNFSKREPNLGYYIIMTDAKETEVNYLRGLRDSLPKNLRGRLVIKVFTARTAKLVEECKNKALSEPQYRMPWIVLDRDQVVNFDGIVETAEREGISVGWSNPCIEIWFEAYFGKMGSAQDSTNCVNHFSTVFKSKTGLEYKKEMRDIYALLNRCGDEDKAIGIARARYRQCLSNQSKPSQMCPCVTLFRLVGEVKSKVRRA